MRTPIYACDRLRMERLFLMNFVVGINSRISLDKLPLHSRCSVDLASKVQVINQLCFPNSFLIESVEK